MQLELIRKKIEELKKLEDWNEHNQRLYRVKFRAILKEIEDLGGWIALGYSSASEYYEAEFGIVSTTGSQHNSAKDYEILLGIPLGHYSHKDFEGIKKQFIFNNRGRGVCCKIENAIAIREKWREICEKAGTNLPTGQQIYDLSEAKIKKSFTASSTYYQSKIDKATQKLNGEIQELKKALELGKQELEWERAATERLKKQLEEKIPAIAMQKIASLREERDRLKQENEFLKVKLESLTVKNQ